jgi:hypothetical protein
LGWWGVDLWIFGAGGVGGLWTWRVVVDVAGSDVG